MRWSWPKGERGLRASHHRVIGKVPPEGITVTELSERVGMTKQGIGQFVTQLTEPVPDRRPLDPEDRRIRVVRRTAKGDAAVRRLSRLLDGSRRAGRIGSGPADTTDFRAILDDSPGETELAETDSTDQLSSRGSGRTSGQPADLGGSRVGRPEVAH